MSTKVTRSVQIVCEGCAKVYGELGQFDHAGDARGAALAAGWKLIPKTLASGRAVRVDPTNSKRLVNITRQAHDVCPDCVDSFSPGEYEGAPNGRKSWWTERIEQLEKENAALRAGQPSGRGSWG